MDWTGISTVAHTAYTQLQVISYVVRGQGCSAMATRLMTSLIMIIKSKCSVGLRLAVQQQVTLVLVELAISRGAESGLATESLQSRLLKG